MSNIGSISNSGNKFNVVASTLSTEQLEGFGKSGNLMPNAIIVSINFDILYFILAMITV